MPFDPESLRVILRCWASGVTVVTASDGTVTHGMTVSSFTSVSLTPPLVLVCIERGTRTHGLIRASRAFGVSFLRSGQAGQSDRFAGRETENGNRLEGLATFTARTGAPILADCLAYLDCSVAQAHEAGTHTIFVGEVLAGEVLDGVEPLLYWDRDYHTLFP